MAMAMARHGHGHGHPGLGHGHAHGQACPWPWPCPWPGPRPWPWPWSQPWPLPWPAWSGLAWPGFAWPGLAWPGDTKYRKVKFWTRKKYFKKHMFAGTGDLEIRPFNGPPGSQKRTREVKSTWIDPRRAPEKPLEPSYGRFSEKSDQKPWISDHFPHPMPPLFAPANGSPRSRLARRLCTAF